MILMAKFVKFVLICSLFGQAALADIPVPSATLAKTPQSLFVQNIVDRFQPVILARHKQTLKISFYETGWFQASTGWNKKENQLVMRVHSGIFELPQLGIAAVTCHELGHILGDVPLSAIPNHRKTTFDPQDSVEGEADYFAGRCMRMLYKNIDEEEIIQAFAKVIEKLKGTKIDRSERLPDFNGIDQEYPSPACRVLSFENGLKLLQRPRCWYNPK